MYSFLLFIQNVFCLVIPYVRSQKMLLHSTLTHFVVSTDVTLVMNGVADHF